MVEASRSDAETSRDGAEVSEEVSYEMSTTNQRAGLRWTSSLGIRQGRRSDLSRVPFCSLSLLQAARRSSKQLCEVTGEVEVREAGQAVALIAGESTAFRAWPPARATLCTLGSNTSPRRQLRRRTDDGFTVRQAS